MLAYFEIIEEPTSDFRFNLVAPDNIKLLAGEIFITKVSCQYVIAAVKAHCSQIANFDISNGAPEENRFRLKAPNGMVLGVSDGYRDKTELEEAILAVQKFAPDAYVIDRSD